MFIFLGYGAEYSRNPPPPDFHPPYNGPYGQSQYGYHYGV